MTDKTIAVIDMDIVLYRCAAANEKRSIVAIHQKTGDSSEHPTRTEFKTTLKGGDNYDQYLIEDVQTPGELANTYHMVKTSIEAIKKSCKASSVELYVGGKGNFRDSLHLPSKYKGSRVKNIKPLQLQSCIDWAIKKLGAVVVNGEEVDDMLARRSYEGLRKGDINISCTIDGDANGTEGYLYNYDSMFAPKLIQGLGEIYLTKQRSDFDGYGRKFFYSQWMIGDSVDCFKPCEIASKKFGPVSLYKLLANCKTDKECVEAVYKQYKDWYPNGATYTDWQGVERTKTTIELMDMYAHCAHMRRFDGDVFNTEKLLNNLGIQL